MPTSRSIKYIFTIESKKSRLINDRFEMTEGIRFTSIRFTSIMSCFLLSDYCYAKVQKVKYSFLVGYSKW